MREAEAGGRSSTFTFSTRTVDYALQFGIGLELGAIFGNIRYSHGILDIDSKHADWKARGIQLLIGITLG